MNTFTRDGDRDVIDGVEVSKAQWKAELREQEGDEDEDDYDVEEEYAG
jgi:hypothetical protein